MVDQLEALDDSRGIDPDQDMDRLTRVADGAGEIRVQIKIASQCVASVHRNERRISFDLAKTVSGFKELRRLCIGEELFEPSCRGRQRYRSEQEKSCEQQPECGMRYFRHNARKCVVSIVTMHSLVRPAFIVVLRASIRRRDLILDVAQHCSVSTSPSLFQDKERSEC